MKLHNLRMVDYELPLDDEFEEKFAREYVRIDIEGESTNKKQRRTMAYKFTFPEESSLMTVSVLNSRALSFLTRKDVSGRIEALYIEEGSSVENKYAWTKSKSTEKLLELIVSDNVKVADKLKAISELNKITGIEPDKQVEIKPEEKEEKSTIETFFDKIKKSSGGA